MIGLMGPRMVGGSPWRALEHPCATIPERERERDNSANVFTLWEKSLGTARAWNIRRFNQRRSHGEGDKHRSRYGPNTDVFLGGDTVEPDTVSLLLMKAGDIESNPGPRMTTRSQTRGATNIHTPYTTGHNNTNQQHNNSADN